MSYPSCCRKGRESRSAPLVVSYAWEDVCSSVKVRSLLLRDGDSALYLQDDPALLRSCRCAGTGGGRMDWCEGYEDRAG